MGRSFSTESDTQEGSLAKPLRVVVTCTDRKTVAPSPERQARSLSGSLEQRVATWVNAIPAPTVKSATAGDLYSGEHWRVASSIPRRAPKGWRVELWIA